MGQNQTVKDNRITVIDALRGFALLGVVLVHMQQHYSIFNFGAFTPTEPAFPVLDEWIGLHLLAQLKDPPPDAALRAAARQYGVRCSLLSDYDLTGTAHSAAGTLVLGYGSLPDADCAAAGERLKKLCTAAREASDTV